MQNKFLTVILSFVIAFGLWAYVMTVQAPESDKTYYQVPVVLDGQNILAERNLMIVSKSDFKVNLTLSGYRTDLNKLDSTNITLVADLSQITEPGVHRIHYSVSYPGSQTGTIHTLEKDPQFIEISVVELSKKEIPVNVSFTGTLPGGYTADRQNVTLDHASVTVAGPKDVVDKIAQARITVDLTGKSESISQTYRHALCDENGEPIEDVSSITVNVSDIRANIIIRKLKEIPLIIKVIPGGGITEDMAQITLDRTSITVAGSEAALEDLNEIVLGSIDLGMLVGSETKFFDIVLPEGIINVTGITSVEVDIQMPTMETQIFVVTTFQAINVPNWARVTFQTEQIEVKLRGPAQLLDRIETRDITVIVDFSDAQLGSSSYKAIVQIYGMEAVGPVGNYIVSAQVSLRSLTEA